MATSVPEPDKMDSTTPEKFFKAIEQGDVEEAIDLLANDLLDSVKLALTTVLAETMAPGFSHTRAYIVDEVLGTVNDYYANHYH